MSARRAVDDGAVLHLEGDVGRGQRRTVERSLHRALRSSYGVVQVDLAGTRHLHYEVARSLVDTARGERRLQLVGASPYVRRILCLVGGIESEAIDYRGPEESTGDAAA